MKIITDNQYYQAIANAIRNKLSSSDTYLPSDMATMISQIPSGGGGGDISEYLSGEATSVSDGTVDFLRAYALYNFYRMTSCSLTAVEQVGTKAFYGCTSLRDLDLPLAYSIAEDAFVNCRAIQKIELPSLETLKLSMFDGCENLQTLDLSAVTQIYGFLDSNVPLEYLVLRVSSIPVLAETSPLGSLINTIYVTDSLVEDFRTATNWSAYASKIQPVSDYIG